MITQLLVKVLVISVVLTTLTTPTECQIFPPLRMAMETGSKIMGFLRLPSLDQLNPFKRETPKIQSYKYVPPPIQSLDEYSPVHDPPPPHPPHIINHGIPKQRPGENIHKSPPHSFGGPGASHHHQNPNIQFHHVRNSPPNPKPHQNFVPSNHQNQAPHHFKDHGPQHHNRIPPHQNFDKHRNKNHGFRNHQIGVTSSQENHNSPHENFAPHRENHNKNHGFQNHQIRVTSSQENHNPPHENFVPHRESHNPHHGNHFPFHEHHNSQQHDFRRPPDQQSHQAHKFVHQEEEPSHHETRDPHNHQSFVSNFQHIDFNTKNPQRPNNNANEYYEEEGDVNPQNFVHVDASSENPFSNDVNKFTSFEFTKNNNQHKQHSQEHSNNASPFDTRHESVFHHPSQNIHHGGPPKQFEASNPFPNKEHEEESFRPTKIRPSFQRPKPDLKHSRKPTVFSHRDLVKKPPSFSSNKNRDKIVSHHPRNPQPDKESLVPKTNENSDDDFFSSGKDFESYMENLQSNKDKHRSEKDPNSVGFGFMYSSQGTGFKGSKSNSPDSFSQPKLTKPQATPFPDFSPHKKVNSNTPFKDELYEELYDNTFSTSQQQNHNSHSPQDIKQSEDFYSHNLGSVTKPTESKPTEIKNQFEDFKKSNKRPSTFRPKVKKTRNGDFSETEKPEKESYSSVHTSFNTFSNDRKIPTANNVGATENEFYQTGYEHEAAEIRKKGKKKFNKPEENSEPEPVYQSGFSEVSKNNLKPLEFKPSSDRPIKKKEEVKQRSPSRGNFGSQHPKFNQMNSENSQSHSNFFLSFGDNVDENEDKKIEQLTISAPTQETHSQRTFRKPQNPDFEPKNGEWSKKEGMSRPIFKLRTQRIRKTTTPDPNE